jgi:hypothetical protein
VLPLHIADGRWIRGAARPSIFANIVQIISIIRRAIHRDADSVAASFRSAGLPQAGARACLPGSSTVSIESNP